jgi:hypothetical protein
MPSNNIQISQSTFETIDTAVYRFLDEQLSIHTVSNTGLSKVPVLWLGTERVHQIKNDKDLRDKVGKLKLPLITLSRTAVSRDTDFRGSYRSYYPPDIGPEGGRVAITRIIKQEKTRNFANATENARPIRGDYTGPSSNTRVVYETILIPKPTYVTCMYEVNIRTEYQQQMNDILPPLIIDQKNVAIIKHDGFQYEMFIQADYGITNNISALGTEERMFTARVQFKVLGYLTGDGENGSVPKIIRQQNAVNISVSRERVVGRSIADGLRTVSSVIESDSGLDDGYGDGDNDNNDSTDKEGEFQPTPDPEFTIGGQPVEPDGRWYPLEGDPED